MKGYVQIYTGNGEAETVTVLGLALRAAGAGYNVFIVRFNKKIDDNEMNALGYFTDLITVEQYGLGRFIDGRPLPEDIAAARNGLKRAASILSSGKHRLVVLDKAIAAASSGFFTEQELLDVLSARPEHVELVVTGQEASPRIIEQADLVTEMKFVKHY